MTSASHVSTPAAKRSALLPLAVTLLAAASYAAGVLTPTILASAMVAPAGTTTVTTIHERQGPPDDRITTVQRQGPPDDQNPGVRVPEGDGTSMGH